MRMLASIRHLPPYREAEGFPLERLVEAGNTGQTVSRLEPDRRLQRCSWSPDLVCGWRPALLLGPHQAPGWPIASVQHRRRWRSRESFGVPRGTALPEPSSGLWREVGEGQRASVKLTYRGLMSDFHDGTAMAVADLLYPYSMAVRWGTRGSANPWHTIPSSMVRPPLCGPSWPG